MSQTATATATKPAPRTDAERWARLQADLAAAGITASLEERQVQDHGSRSRRPGWTTRRSLDVGTPTRHVHIADAWWSKNTDVWIGYRVTVEERATSFIIGRPTTTKKRNEVVAAVQAGLA